MRDWTEMPVFDELDLSESYILSWVQSNGRLQFGVDFVLAPGHPAYQPPTQDEWACYKRGTLNFSNVRSLNGLPEMAAVRHAIDATGERDYGHFDSFTEVRPGSFTIAGDFGVAYVEADNPSVVLPDRVA